MPRFGIASTLIDGRDLAAWEGAVRPETKAFFLESPTNPQLEIVDIRGVSEIARGCDARLFVDNVFASPMLQKPIEMGADVVMYSTTKHIDGQGRCLGGVICCAQDFHDEFLDPYLKHTGPALSPFNAWVMLKSLETLPLRIDVMCGNARAGDRDADRPRGDRARALPRAPLPPAAQPRHEPDVGRRNGRRLRRRLEDARVLVDERVEARQDLQQPGRREEPDHSPGHDDAISA